MREINLKAIKNISPGGCLIFSSLFPSCTNCRSLCACGDVRYDINYNEKLDNVRMIKSLFVDYEIYE